jgi:hypothetical protein
MATDRELQRNHFESFSLRFEIPEAQRAQRAETNSQPSDHPKKISSIRSSEMNKDHRSGEYYSDPLDQGDEYVSHQVTCGRPPARK